MSNEDVVRELDINRVFLILLLLGGGGMFAFIGVMAWWSIRMVNAELKKLTFLLSMVVRKMGEVDSRQNPPP